MKNRRPHGFYWFLLSVLLMLSAAVSSRAQTDPPPPPPITDATVITNNDDLVLLTNGGTFAFATNGTFTLSNTPVAIRTNTIIDATGLNVTLTGLFTNRLFNISNNATLTLINLTITGGKNAQGAAIYNNLSTLYASNVTFTGNRATNASGAKGATGSSGNINGGNGGNGASGFGGAIYSNRGLLILTNCTFTNNIAAGGNGGNGGDGFNSLGGDGGNGGDGGTAFGGAIYSTGTNYVTGCYFVVNGVFGGSGGAGGLAGSGPVNGATGAGGQGNTAGGAAIFLATGGILNVTNSTFHANQSYGGDSGPQSISANGISSNAKNGGPAIGGGVESFGTFYVENSTFFTNTVLGGKGGDTLGDANANAGAGGGALGGAVANAGVSFTARNCTFATNNAIGGTNGVSPFSNRNGQTGAVEGANLGRTAGTSKIYNCILQHGKGPDNYGALVDGGFNISSDTSCAFTSTNSVSKANALMADKLSIYPGYPPLLEFITGSTNQSPALDKIPAIPSGNPTNVPSTDERGFPRFSGTNTLADIGAFEFAPTPPRILVQPTNQFVTAGQTASFNVSATGAATLTYQWFFIGTNGLLTTNHYGTNLTDATISITNVQSTNLGTYFVVVTNGLGSVTSSNATLGFVSAPAITSQSGPVEVPLGGTATFSVTATGAPLTYQWFNGTTALTDVSNHVGSATATLTINNATKTDHASYHVVVSNAKGTAQSAPAFLTVDDPAIITQPSDATVNYGASAVFSVTAIGSTNLVYFWRSNNVNIAGATKASYTNASAKVSANYTVVVSNVFSGPFGVITSQVATLTVLNPAITIPPTNLVVDLGGTAVFNVAAAGAGTTNFQWYFNNAALASQTNKSLTITNSAFTNAGTYSVIVTSTTSTATNTASASATLTVLGTSSVSGRILFGTNGVPGVILTNGVTNAISGADGSYAFTHLTNGTYIVAPKQVGSGLTPLSTNVVVDATNPTNIINFVFNAPHLSITSTPTNNIVPLLVVSAPQQTHRLEYSSDLMSWSISSNLTSNFTTDTNGIAAIMATNSTAASNFFIRVGSPVVDQPPPPPVN